MKNQIYSGIADQPYIAGLERQQNSEELQPLVWRIRQVDSFLYLSCDMEVSKDNDVRCFYKSVQAKSFGMFRL